MLVYVGLNLGVDTEVVTNSFAPKMHLRTNRRWNDNDAPRARDVELGQL
jgi:hypothetical protein